MINKITIGISAFKICIRNKTLYEISFIQYVRAFESKILNQLFDNNTPIPDIVLAISKESYKDGTRDRGT